MQAVFPLVVGVSALVFAVPAPPVAPSGGKGSGGVPGGPGHGHRIACCLPGGECEELGTHVCLEQGGVPHPALHCENVECFASSTGACCVGGLGGHLGCLEVTQNVCAAIGGEFQGDGTECSHNPSEPGPCAPPSVACCLPNTECAELSFHDCLMEGGQPHPNLGCDEIECHDNGIGACCVSNGGINGCIVVPGFLCQQLNGEFLGSGTDCHGDPTHPHPCGQPTLACCLPDGLCEELTLQACLEAGGEPRPFGSCNNIDCSPPQSGACCLAVPGTLGCIETTAAECGQLGGEYRGDGTHCGGNPGGPPPCGSPTVPCCIPSPIPEDICEELPMEECLSRGGQPFPAPSCEFVDCVGSPDIGACCLSNGGVFGGCIVVPAMLCEQMNGEFLGAGSDCFGDPGQPPPCGEPESACCLPDGSCGVTTPHECFEAGGQPRPAPSCDEVDCSMPTLGACCVSTPGILGCIETNATECGKLGGDYLGDGTHCGGNPNEPPPCGPPTVPCCIPAPIPEGICEELAIEECFARGGHPVPGISCENVDCGGGPAIGACCVQAPGGAACIEDSAEVCAQFGGNYQGDGSHCFGDPGQPPPCGEPTIACCLPDSSCVEESIDSCIQSGGEPQNSMACTNVTCNSGPAIGACCVGNGGFLACLMVPANVCTALHGEFQGAGTHCPMNPADPNPCQP